MGFCKSDQKNIPVVGFLTRNDCDVLRAKTGVYRRVTHRTIILPTTFKSYPPHYESHFLKVFFLISYLKKYPLEWFEIWVKERNPRITPTCRASWAVFPSPISTT